MCDKKLRLFEFTTVNYFVAITVSCSPNNIKYMVCREDFHTVINPESMEIVKFSFKF